jgi:NAD(P)H-hydrate epimerase
MAQVDQTAMQAGHRGVDLMESAGAAVAAAVVARWSKRPVLVLCGPGNNGGDGYVAARRLQEAGWPVVVGALGDASRLTGDAAHHARLWTGPTQPLSVDLLPEAELIVDALFGAGLSRPLEGVALAVVRAIVQRGVPVCAIDVPSGLDGASGAVLGAAAPAAVTVTFFRKKPAHVLLPGRVLCGQLIVADIGIPIQALEALNAQAWENDPALWRQAFPWPAADGHKYRRGHVLVLGGATMTGAARLSAQGAARVGAGLVTVAAPPSVWSLYAGSLISIMVQPFDGVQGFERLLHDERMNVVVLGPGAGVNNTTRDCVLSALAAKRAVVLDADAITVFADDPQTLFRAIQIPCGLTPHEGEFARVFPDSGASKLERVRQAARASGAVVLLKGADTVVGAPDGRAIVNTNAPPELATGGSGDVLSGLIAGLMGQGMDAFLAAAAAAWLHGEAARSFGPGLLSEDLPGLIPRALRRLKGQPVAAGGGPTR